jgi:hypothetical protein
MCVTDGGSRAARLHLDVQCLCWVIRSTMVTGVKILMGAHLARRPPLQAIQTSNACCAYAW